MSDRQRALATVHIAKKFLEMDDIEYRKFLQDHTGKNSAADFNPVEMRKIIREFEARGFKIQSQKDEKSREMYLRLVKRLWHQLSRSVDEQASLRRFIFKYHRPKTPPLKRVSDLNSKGWRELGDLELHELKELFERLRGYVSHGYEIR